MRPDGAEASNDYTGEGHQQITALLEGNIRAEISTQGV
jgi:hypothetical protein